MHRGHPLCELGLRDPSMQCIIHNPRCRTKDVAVDMRLQVVVALDELVGVLRLQRMLRELVFKIYVYETIAHQGFVIHLCVFQSGYASANV